MRHNSDLRKETLEDIYSYQLFGAERNEELQEIVNLAGLICETPIALITVLDDTKQFIVAKTGCELTETKASDSFCQYAIADPVENLIVQDAMQDARFAENPLVLEEPHIRAYMGVPLKTKKSNAFGTLCVLDGKPRSFSKAQESALEILSKQAIRVIENRKALLKLEASERMNVERLSSLTNLVPAGFFEFTFDENGKLVFLFVNNGLHEMLPWMDVSKWMSDSTSFFESIEEEDRSVVINQFQSTYKDSSPLNIEFSLNTPLNAIRLELKAKLISAQNDHKIFYGSLFDITHHFEYERVLERIAFDLSHVLRKPVASLSSLTNLLKAQKDKEISSNQIKTIMSFLETTSTELESRVKELESEYFKKKAQITSARK